MSFDLFHFLLDFGGVLAIGHHELGFMVLHEMLHLLVNAVNIVHQHFVGLLNEVLISLGAALNFGPPAPQGQSGRVIVVTVGWRGLHLEKIHI